MAAWYTGIPSLHEAMHSKFYTMKTIPLQFSRQDIYSVLQAITKSYFKIFKLETMSIVCQYDLYFEKLLSTSHDVSRTCLRHTVSCRECSSMPWNADFSPCAHHKFSGGLQLLGCSLGRGPSLQQRIQFP